MHSDFTSPIPRHFVSKIDARKVVIVESRPPDAIGVPPCQ